MNKSSTLLFYYVPEDKDDPQVPNGFIITKAQDQITVKDIEQFFPLKGQYVFRFKHEYEKKKFVWMDLPSSAKRLPSYEDKIFIKATRINWENVKDSSDRVQQQTPAVSVIQTSQNESTPKSQQPIQITQDFSIFENDKTPSVEQKAPASDLIDFD